MMPRRGERGAQYSKLRSTTPCAPSLHPSTSPILISHARFFPSPCLHLSFSLPCPLLPDVFLAQSGVLHGSTHQGVMISPPPTASTPTPSNLLIFRKMNHRLRIQNDKDIFTDTDVFIQDGWEHTAKPRSLIEKHRTECYTIMQLLNHARHCNIFSELVMCFKDKSVTGLIVQS